MLELGVTLAHALAPPYEVTRSVKPCAIRKRQSARSQFFYGLCVSARVAFVLRRGFDCGLARALGVPHYLIRRQMQFAETVGKGKARRVLCSHALPSFDALRTVLRLDWLQASRTSPR